MSNYSILTRVLWKIHILKMSEKNYAKAMMKNEG